MALAAGTLLGLDEAALGAGCVQSQAYTPRSGEWESFRRLYQSSTVISTASAVIIAMKMSAFVMSFLCLRGGGGRRDVSDSGSSVNVDR